MIPFNLLPSVFGAFNVDFFLKLLPVLPCSFPFLMKGSHSLFTELDYNISICQSEIEKWKELKKGMLQKMFPKEGESVPEIRFPGFGEPWEQRKLGDWCNIITKGTTPSTFCEDGEVTFVKIEAIRGKYVDKNLCSAIDENIHQTVLARSILKENDIVFAIAGATVGKCAIITADLLPANTNQALAIIRLKNCIDREFVYSSLMSSQMAKYIYESKSVGAQPNLSLAQINEFTFWCPTSQSEQQRIGQLISTFDILIYLYQLELEKWQSLKKALLQQMFV